MDLKNLFKINHFSKILPVLAAGVILLFVFSIGVFVGTEKAKFSYRWGENYYNNIIGRRDMINPDRQFFNPHNDAGKIININGNNIIIKNQENIEKTITVNNETVIRKQNQSLKISNLKIGDYIVVIGAPNNQGQIEAKLIRVLPPDNFFPPQFNRITPPINNN